MSASDAWAQGVGRADDVRPTELDLRAGIEDGGGGGIEFEPGFHAPADFFATVEQSLLDAKRAIRRRKVPIRPFGLGDRRDKLVAELLDRGTLGALGEADLGERDFPPEAAQQRLVEASAEAHGV